METQIKIHNILKFFLFSFLIFFCFLFFNVSHAQAATLYYNNAAADNDWNTLASWWTDAGFTIPASSLPGASDDVIMAGDIYVNSGPVIVVNTITTDSASSLQISVTVLNGATFNGISFYQNGTLTGNAVFNNDSFFNSSGIVTGSATYNSAHAGVFTIADGNSWFGGTAGSYLGDDALPITTWVFNGSSINNATVPGNAIFHNTSKNDEHNTVNGNAIFYDSSINYGGTVSGNATFYDSSNNVNVSHVIFHGTITTYGTVSGNATFNNLSFNNGTVSLNAIFNNSSFNSSSGIISGDAIFNDLTYNIGSVSGNATFNHATSGTLYFIGDAGWGFVGGTVKDGSGATITDLVLNDNSTANAIFNGNAKFYDTTVNQDEITGDACFAATATNNGTVDGTTTTPCPILLPIVATQAGTPLTRTTEILNGDILSTGGEHPSERGFDYGLDPTLTTVIGTVVDTAGQPFAAGSFSANISDLICGTTYYARAYAINSINTGFGAIVPFTTVACPQGSGPLLTYTTNSAGGSTIILPPQKPTPPIAETICRAGDYFSTTTGRPCTSFENPPVSSCPITITLRLGSRGTQVRCLQTGLNIISDGIFGLKTKAAVIVFQKSKNLIPDGVFGPKSRALWK